jgi:hypothetical protein
MLLQNMDKNLPYYMALHRGIRINLFSVMLISLSSLCYLLLQTELTISFSGSLGFWPLRGSSTAQHRPHITTEQFQLLCGLQLVPRSLFAPKTTNLSSKCGWQVGAGDLPPPCQTLK